MAYLRKLTADEVKFHFEAEEDDLRVRGNAIASGDDDAYDKEVEDEIIARLNNGDIAAWFSAHVTATWNGFEGEDWLGACSYESLEQFTNTKGDYYDDMKAQALDELNKRVAEAYADIMKLVVDGEPEANHA